VSDVLDIRLLGEQVKRLQEDVRGLKLTVELQGQTLAAQFQTGFQQVAEVIGKHLAVQDRRLDNLTNVLAEHIKDTATRFDRLDETLARIEARFPV
jgi:hypothetical protein